MRRIAVAVALGLAACAVGGEGVPEGELAVVGDVVLGPDDLASVQAQLGGYAQLRFRGGEGRGALLEALIAAELLAQQAVRNGVGDHPVVHWALHEEVATVYLGAQLERRVPRAEVAQDVAALRAWYDAHPEAFARPQRRVMEGVSFKTLDAAEVALDLLREGSVQLEWLGEVVRTEPQVRDDTEHPGFHPLLFDAALRQGDLLPHPVLLGSTAFVGRVAAIEPAGREPFDDPAVRERLVQEVRAPRLEAARQALLAELAERYPEAPPS